MPSLKITVAGIGYVGLSNAILLAQNSHVVAIDIDKSRVDMLNARKCPIKDADMEHYLTNNSLNLLATTDKYVAYSDADFVIVATPTNYNPLTNAFDTSSVEDVISTVSIIAPNAIIVIKSTIPVGYTREVSNRLNTTQVMFSPEFLREGHALRDNLYPSRIVVGEDSDRGRIFANLLASAAISDNVSILLTGPEEAEAIKLFSNTYLAMRVAYFNELDSYALTKGMDSRSIIQGVGLDPRIGEHYNNPSFGYGGYCLPKDSKQLLANYTDIPQNLITAIVQSNSTRKDTIVNHILSSAPAVVGVYRLVMKTGSDNFRQSAVQDVICSLLEAGTEVLIYEPAIVDANFLGAKVTNDLGYFKKQVDLIVANRIDPELSDVADRVFTRDIFSKD